MYVNYFVGDIRGNPRNFYRYANSQRKNNQGLPPLKKRDGSGLAESKTDQAEEVNGQFTDVFTQSRCNEAPLLNRSAPRMNDISVSDGVTKLLKGLTPSKAMGPDELHPRILDTGEIPEEWSLANICPFFKKGDRALASNYRPVSLTCILCKLLEHIV